MKKLLVLAILVGGFQLLCTSQNVLTEKSNIEFKVANLGANKVKGNFTGMKGTVKFDPKNITQASFDVCIDATTLDTRMKKRDQTLKGPKYFDVENYPEICFKSKSVTQIGMSYKVTGTLEMHGVKKDIDITFNYSRNSFTGKLKVNRLDFKVGPKSGILVAKEVDITITCFVE